MQSRHFQQTSTLQHKSRMNIHMQEFFLSQVNSVVKHLVNVTMFIHPAIWHSFLDITHIKAA